MYCRDRNLGQLGQGSSDIVVNQNDLPSDTVAVRAEQLLKETDRLRKYILLIIEYFLLKVNNFQCRRHSLNSTKKEQKRRTTTMRRAILKQTLPRVPDTSCVKVSEVS